MILTALVTILVLLPVLIFGLWHFTASDIPAPPPSLRNKRIILLIAHPDDESMFFAPTLQALTAPSLANHVKILCMSTGDADGLGETRRKELEKAAVTLGLRRREDVFVLDDERFRDGMNEDWKKEDVAHVLASAFAPHLNQATAAPAPAATDTTTPDDKKEGREVRPSKSKSGNRTSKSSSGKASPTAAAPSPPPPPPAPTGPRATIDVLITFDPSGISGHPNHISLHHGAKHFLGQIMKGHAGHTCPVTLYTLPSINILRKYSFILDAVPTLLGSMMSSVSGSAPAPRDDRLVFVNDMARYMKARNAMLEGHKSQMVWFRHGWIGVGRYMVVNDLKAEEINAT